MNEVPSAPPSTLLTKVLDEYVLELEAGTAPSREALLERYPELADELAAALLGFEFVRGAAPSLGGGDATPSGRSLGDYRILREVDRGGMAVVYEAEQISLGRRVALKVLPFAAVLEPKKLQRFKNEALAAAQLHHPHIVPVYAVGCERGVHYYAMQYVEGQSLAHAIRDMRDGSRGLEPATPVTSHGSHRDTGYVQMAMTLGIQAAEALDHAHELGVIHRDVKPGNLLVDRAGSLWVTDFGLARTLRDTGLTITGELLGTVRYMSPEQAMAHPAPVDLRTDVYSLGVTLFELLTLEPAVPGDDPHQVLQNTITKEPVMPRRINPAISFDLETVLLKAMSKEPGSRYATAQEMADDLRRCLEDLPVLARRPSVATRAARCARRHRGLVFAVATILFVAVGALAVGAGREAYKTRAALAQSEANLGIARDAVNRFLLEAATDSFADGPLPPPSRQALLQSALEFHATTPEDPRSIYWSYFILHALRRYDDALAAAEQAVALRPHGVSEMVRLAHMLSHLSRAEEALAVLDRAVGVDRDSSDVHHERGNALYELDRFEEAVVAHDRAVALDSTRVDLHAARGDALDAAGRAEDALAAHDLAVSLERFNARAHQGRGNALQSLDRLEEALAAYDQAIAILPDYAGSHFERGRTLQSLGRLEEALAAHEHAIAIDPDLAQAHLAKGQTLMALRRFDDAVEALERAAELAPDDAETHHDRGMALQAAARIPEAVAAHERAIELEPENATCHYNLGNVLLEADDPERAMEAFIEAIRLRPEYAKAHCNLGSVLRRAGDLEAATQEFEESIRLDPRLSEAHLGIGNVRFDAGQVDGAIEAYRAAILLRDDYAKAHSNLGLALARVGRFEEAMPSLRRGLELGSNYPAEAWIARTQRMAELEPRLDRLLSGAEPPRDSLERVDLAELLYAKSRYVEAARTWTETFAADPALATDLEQGFRYSAARCAARAAATAGDASAADWRHRALQWLRADLEARASSGLGASVAGWEQDPEFAGLRDRLDELPVQEREEWTKLWAAVAAALR